MTKTEVMKILQQEIESYNLNTFLKFHCGLAQVDYYFYLWFKQYI